MIKRKIDTASARAQIGTIVEPRDQGTNILVVDDDTKLLEALDLYLSPYRPIRAADTYAAAMKAIEDGESFCGAIVDVRLDHGLNGLEIVAALRQKQPHIPVVVLTGDPTPQVLSRSFPLGVQVLAKGFASPHLAGFAIRCMIADQDEDAAILAALGAYAQDHGLTPGEAEVLLGALRNRRLEWFVAHGMARSTYKARAASVLRKTGHTNLADIGPTIFRHALVLARELRAL